METIKYNLNIKTAEDVTKVQDAAIKAASSARVKIQVALVATLIHLAKFHDVQMARRLVDGLNDTVRGNALVKWLTKYGHLTVGTIEVQDGEKTRKVETFNGIVGGADDHAKSIRESLDEAKAEMWWAMIKAKSPYKFDADAALNAVLAQAKSAMKKVADGKANAEDVSITVNDATVQAVLAFAKFEPVEA